MARILHDALHPASRYSLITVALCWGLLAYLTGAIVGVLLALLVLVLLLATVRAALRRTDNAHVMRSSINEALHIATYGLTASMVTLTVLPYLLPAGARLDIYAMLLYLNVPTLLIFNTIIHYSHHRIAGDDPWIFASIGVGTVKTAVLVAMIIGGVAFATNAAADALEQRQQHIIRDVLPAAAVPQSLADLEVAQEIQTQWRSEYDRARASIAGDCTLCRPSGMLKRTAQSTEAVVSVQFTAMIAEAFNQQRRLVQSATQDQLAENLASSRRTVIAHRDRFDEPEREIEELSVEQLWEFVRSDVDLPPPAERTLRFTFGGSPLHNSMQRALAHTLLWHQGLDVIDRIATQRVLAYPPLIRTLYENRNVEESLESKTVRYLILASWAEQTS